MPERRRPDIWLPAYAAGALARAQGRRHRRQRLTDIIFLICDHFEPRHGISNAQQPFERLQTWAREYARLQRRCLEAFGVSPIHTWFYPPHHGSEHLAHLAEMVFDGLGEVELHYHHGDDTEETLQEGLKQAMAEYRRWGMLLESGAQPRQSFGFVHGDWALNNSRHGLFCGVNDETRILRELGCWADFTMPSGIVGQTRKVNSIYYAQSDPQRPKGHDAGVDARVGVADASGLLLMQGPLAVNWRAPGHPSLENGSVTAENWGRPDRIRTWLDCNVHVKGRPEWLFVKLHTHGAIERDFDALFGERAFAMHRALNEQCNDGRRYRLHYVTARQAYNIVKAAEHGREGNPAEFLDYCIPRQAHAFYSLDAAHDLEHCTIRHLKIGNVAVDRSVSLRARVGAVRSVRGPFRALEINDSVAELRLWPQEHGPGEFRLELDSGFGVERVEGADVLTRQVGTQPHSLVLSLQRACAIHYGRRGASAVHAAVRG